MVREDGCERRARTEVPGLVNYKKSLRWLTSAGEQGLAEAWYAMSRIYLKPEFSQRNLPDAQQYLEKAAEAGHRPAQLELGMVFWSIWPVQAASDPGANRRGTTGAQSHCPFIRGCGLRPAWAGRQLPAALVSA